MRHNLLSIGCDPGTSTQTEVGADEGSDEHKKEVRRTYLDSWVSKSIPPDTDAQPLGRSYLRLRAAWTRAHGRLGSR